jgi:uncharacterized protein with GYD domain
MTVYMYQASYTAKSMAAQLTEPHDPLEAIRPTLEELGAKILVAGFPFGEYDVLVVYEAPDDMTAASVAMAIAAAGEVKSGKTTRLLSGQEWLESLRKRRIVTMRKAHSPHDPHAQLPELLSAGGGSAGAIRSRMSSQRSGTGGACQPRQQAAPRPAAADGLGVQSRPVEHRQADDAVAGGAAIPKGRYRRRDSDPLR